MLLFLCQEYDIGGRSHGNVLTGKGEGAGLLIDSESGDGVGLLVAAVKEIAGRIDGEAAWVVTMGPFLANICQFAIVADGEIGNAVMQPVGSVYESGIA